MFAKSWGQDTFSRNARDLIRIAVGIGGYDAAELVMGCFRRQRGRMARVNERTVLNVLLEIRARYRA